MKNIFDTFPDSYIESSKRMIQTPSPIARSTFFYVQETGYLKLKESHRASRKNLDSYLVVLVLSGSGTLMYAGKTYPLEKGSCFFIDCMTPYYHQSNAEDPWELIWVHFQGATTPEYYRFFSGFSAPCFFPSAFGELHEKFISLLDVNKESNLSAEIASSRLIMDILSILLQEITKPKETAAPHKINLEQVRNYLDEHYTEKFSLDELAEEFFISKFHLSREFKRITDMTVFEFVNLTRCTEARRLIESGAKVTEAAEACGYENMSYFTRTFKKQFGVLPSTLLTK